MEKNEKILQRSVKSGKLVKTAAKSGELVEETTEKIAKLPIKSENQKE